MQVQSLALLSGLRSQHCSELWCRSQTWLRSHVAVAVGWAGSWSSNSTPSLGTSICSGCGPKKQKKNKNKNNFIWPSCFQMRILRSQEIKWLLWGHTVDWWQIKTANPTALCSTLLNTAGDGGRKKAKRGKETQWDPPTCGRPDLLSTLRPALSSAWHHQLKVKTGCFLQESPHWVLPSVCIFSPLCAHRGSPTFSLFFLCWGTLFKILLSKSCDFCPSFHWFLGLGWILQLLMA